MEVNTKEKYVCEYATVGDFNTETENEENNAIRKNVEKEHAYKLTAGKIIFGLGCFILGVAFGENKAVKEIEKRALNSILNNKPIKISKNLTFNIKN